MTRQITITPPPGLFAAVNVELHDGTVVGAAGPCFDEVWVQVGTNGVDENGDPVPVYGTHKIPRTQITANVKTDTDSLLLRWVYENDSLGTTTAEYGQPSRRSGGR